MEVFVYEQLVGDDEAAISFKRMPAFGDYAVFWQPPEPAPDADDDALNIRIIAGKPADGSPWVLLSAVAFGALKGCLPASPGKVANASPTVDTSAQLARLIMDCCKERVVGHGPSKKNLVGHRSSRAVTFHSVDTGPRTYRVESKRLKTAPSSRAPSLWESAFRCVRSGGAFGVLYGVSSTTAAAKERICHPRCDAGLPRSLYGTVAVPIVRGEHVSGLCPLWISPVTGMGASFPASSHPPVSGADVTGAELAQLMERDEPGACDGVHMLARMTSVKLTVAGILLSLGADEHLGMSIGMELAAETVALWTLVQSGELSGQSAPLTRRQRALGLPDERVDNAPEAAAALSKYISLHHATLGGHCGGHVDTMGEGLEDKVALAGIGGMEFEPIHLESSGGLMALPPSACAFQAYKVATLLSSPGPSPDDGDVEISGATHRSCFHAHPSPSSSGPWYRAALVRSLLRIYLRGGALCDHPRVGSAGWVENAQRRHGLTLQECLAIQILPNRNKIQTYMQMTDAQRQALMAHYLALLQGPYAGAAGGAGADAGAGAAAGAAAADAAAADAAAADADAAGAAAAAAAAAAADADAADGVVLQVRFDEEDIPQWIHPFQSGTSEPVLPRLEQLEAFLQLDKSTYEALMQRTGEVYLGALVEHWGYDDAAIESATRIVRRWEEEANAQHASATSATSGAGAGAASASASGAGAGSSSALVVCAQHGDGMLQQAAAIAPSERALGKSRVSGTAAAAAAADAAAAARSAFQQAFERGYERAGQRRALALQASRQAPGPQQQAAQAGGGDYRVSTPEAEFIHSEDSD